MSRDLGYYAKHQEEILFGIKREYVEDTLAVGDKKFEIKEN